MNRNWIFNENYDFAFNLSNFDTVDTNDFLDAVDKTTKLIEQDFKKLNMNKVGLCLSGSDSELIAHYLHKNSIPTEYFFLNIDNINSTELELCKKIANKYNTNLNVLTIKSQELLDVFIYENFNITHTCWPTYATLPTLIKHIPQNYYIVMGEGDLEKGWQRYRTIYDRKIKIHDESNFYIPIHLTEISYTLALKHFNKHGEGNFYSRCFDLWYHILKDPSLITDGVCLFDPKPKILHQIIKKLNLLSPTKTMNYDDGGVNSDARRILGDQIIKNLKQYGKTNFKNWDPIIGDIIIMPKSMINKQ